MTPEQVSVLSDTELNRAMIWFFPHLNSFIWVDTGTEVWVGPKKLTNPHWSYLLNWNLTMPLAVENELEISFMPVTRCEECYDGKVATNQNPLRAICECLVLIALESKK